MCLIMLEIDLPTSLGVLLRNVSKMDRRLYKQPRKEIKTMKANSFTRAYICTPMIHTYGGNTSLDAAVSQTGADRRVNSVSQCQSHDWWGINLTYMFSLLACTKVHVTYIHGQTLASISHSCNSRAHVSNS